MEVVRPVKPGESSAARSPADAGTTPFRFYDNRQKYLAFVNTCNEKSAVANRAARELRQVRPTQPALRLFDAGMGDATVLRAAHAPCACAVPDRAAHGGREEISLEDVRLGLEKMPDRFMEHPATVLVDHEPQLFRSAAPPAPRRRFRRGASTGTRSG
jgi:hypothetical protein